MSCDGMCDGIILLSKGGYRQKGEALLLVIASKHEKSAAVNCPKNFNKIPL
ncbi:MAG: hypothetical protein PHC49_14560 [Desulfuromonadaceae bacterium]|nr:hypothetical protein [Desulfuromonadaceae bacterium]